MNSMRTVRPRGAVPRRHTAPGGKHQRKGPAWRWHGEARSSSRVEGETLWKWITLSKLREKDLDTLDTRPVCLLQYV